MSTPRSARVFTVSVVTLGVALLLAATAPPALVAQGAPEAGCPRCGWTPPVAKRLRRVKTAGDLYREVESASPGTEIRLEPGEYRLDRTLAISTGGVTLRGAGDAASAVVLRGAGMTNGRVGVGISVAAPNVTLAGLSVGEVAFHGIQVHGELGASAVMVHDVRVFDTGQQLLKGSTDGGRRFADDGVVACSTFEYSDHAPSSYTNGVDVLAGRNWTVRDNTFRRIRGIPAQRYGSGPTILFWANSIGTRVERNVIIDSFRGIAFGLGPGASAALARDGEGRLDHQGGVIRDNVVVNTHDWADEGIEVNAAGAVAIDHNTVVTRGILPWSISVRFPSSAAFTRNNLTSKPIMTRDGGQMTGSGNVTGAADDWFVNLAGGDARLTAAAAARAGGAGASGERP